MERVHPFAATTSQNSTAPSVPGTQSASMESAMVQAALQRFSIQPLPLQIPDLPQPLRLTFPAPGPSIEPDIAALPNTTPWYSSCCPCPKAAVRVAPDLGAEREDTASRSEHDAYVSRDRAG